MIAKKVILETSLQLCSYCYYNRGSISRGNFILQENESDRERDRTTGGRFEIKKRKGVCSSAADSGA